MQASIDIGDNIITLTTEGKGFTITDLSTLDVRLHRLPDGGDVSIDYDRSNIVAALAAQRIAAVLGTKGIRVHDV